MNKCNHLFRLEQGNRQHSDSLCLPVANITYFGFHIKLSGFSGFSWIFRVINYSRKRIRWLMNGRHCFDIIMQKKSRKVLVITEKSGFYWTGYAMGWHGMKGYSRQKNSWKNSGALWLDVRARLGKLPIFYFNLCVKMADTAELSSHRDNHFKSDLSAFMCWNGNWNLF